MTYAAELGSSVRDPAAVAGPGPRRGLVRETVIVLGVSLGASALWSILAIVNKLTRATPLSKQTTAMNQSVVPDRPWLDLAYQLVGIGLALVPVLLAIYLLAHVHRPAADVSVGRFIGFDRTRLGKDGLWGLGLAALIGIPGLGFYLLARHLGINTTVAPANLTAVWWSGPVLVLAAIENALLEEVVMIGYLLTRWRQVGWSWPVVLIGSAVIRGSYHLYQGFGGFIGNIVMGLVLGLFFMRKRRVLPLVICHALLDIVAFLGYAILKANGVDL